MQAVRCAQVGQNPSPDPMCSRPSLSTSFQPEAISRAHSFLLCSISYLGSLYLRALSRTLYTECTMLPSRHTRYSLRWLVGSSGENIYLSYPEDPQSEVTPLKIPANARSKLTGRLGGPLRRGATFGALALARTGTFGAKRDRLPRDL